MNVFNIILADNKRAKAAVAQDMLLPVQCEHCGWQGRRVARFIVPIDKTLDRLEALSRAAGCRDNVRCPKCNSCVQRVWPGGRDPKLDPAGGDSFIRKLNGKQETRHVVDRQMGCGVVFTKGKMPTYRSSRYTCTLQEWCNWSLMSVVTRVSKNAEVFK